MIMLVLLPVVVFCKSFEVHIINRKYNVYMSNKDDVVGAKRKEDATVYTFNTSKNDVGEDMVEISSKRPDNGVLYINGGNSVNLNVHSYMWRMIKQNGVFRFETDKHYCITYNRRAQKFILRPCNDKNKSQEFNVVHADRYGSNNKNSVNVIIENEEDSNVKEQESIPIKDYEPVKYEVNDAHLLHELDENDRLKERSVSNVSRKVMKSESLSPAILKKENIEVMVTSTIVKTIVVEETETSTTTSTTTQVNTEFVTEISNTLAIPLKIKPEPKVSVKLREILPVPKGKEDENKLSVQTTLTEKTPDNNFFLKGPVIDEKDLENSKPVDATTLEQPDEEAKNDKREVEGNSDEGSKTFDDEDTGNDKKEGGNDKKEGGNDGLEAENDRLEAGNDKLKADTNFNEGLKSADDSKNEFKEESDEMTKSGNGENVSNVKESKTDGQLSSKAKKSNKKYKKTRKSKKASRSSKKIKKTKKQKKLKRSKNLAIGGQNRALASNSYNIRRFKNQKAFENGVHPSAKNFNSTKSLLNIGETPDNVSYNEQNVNVLTDRPKLFDMVSGLFEADDNKYFDSVIDPMDSFLGVQKQSSKRIIPPQRESAKKVDTYPTPKKLKVNHIGVVKSGTKETKVNANDLKNFIAQQENKNSDSTTPNPETAIKCTLSRSPAPIVRRMNPISEIKKDDMGLSNINRMDNMLNFMQIAI